MPNIAIKIEHLSKMYRLGVINSGTLFRDIQTWMALKRGKEDPHSKIGGNKYKGNKDHFWALKDISLDIQQGDRVGIIGKNGAGKSTLLKILSRITSPTEGTVKIKGKIASLLEVGTGFHGELTGRENIYLNGAILGMKKRRIDQKIDSIIDFCGIEHHIDTPVKRYSSGMYVRLAFAVAAHLDSDILIADEVLAVGDADFQKKALGKMQDLSTGEGRTVLFVSHNMGAVEKLCNTGILLQNGSLIGKPANIKEIIHQYLYSDQNDISLLKSEWINDEDKLDSEWVKPLNFFVSDSAGNPIINSIFNDEEIWINMKVFFKKIDPLITIGYSLYNEKNDLLYITLLTDVAQKEWPKLQVGECILRSKIPSRFLNLGTYRVELFVSLHCRFMLFDPDAPSISFTISGGLSDSPYYVSDRGGVLSPIIPWEVITDKIQ